MPERWAGISEEGTTGASISDWGIAEINSTVLFSPHKYASCEVVISGKLLSSSKTSVIVLDSAAEGSHDAVTTLLLILGPIFSDDYKDAN